MSALSLRDRVKSVAGATVARLSSQCRYDRSIFILAHMRCGSTALSNILCSRQDVSGYGESHIRYDANDSLGRLVVNQALRRTWRPKASHLFDKILHNRHDATAPDTFFQAKAIFLVRPPGAAIRSIRKLYDSLGRDEYGSDDLAATYYVERLTALALLWDRFPRENRVGMTHDVLLSAPERALGDISAALDMTPPLVNRYQSSAHSRKGGGGDPTASGRFTRIETRTTQESIDPIDALMVSDAVKADAQAAYAKMVAAFAK